MRQHAAVTWVETQAPWELEAHMLSSGPRLPLNVDDNPWAEAVAVVKAVRLKARQLADNWTSSLTAAAQGSPDRSVLSPLRTDRAHTLAAHPLLKCVAAWLCTNATCTHRYYCTMTILGTLPD
jgi:hypothetical protein